MMSDAALDSLKFVYSDLVARLVGDNNSTVTILGIAGVLLALLGGMVGNSPASPPSLVVKCSTLVAGISLLASMLFGLCSLLLCRELRQYLPFKKLLLGKAGYEALQSVVPILRAQPPYELSVLHTAHLLEWGVTKEAMADYASSIGEKFGEELVCYVFFLAHVIEIRKRPRLISLTALVLGGAGIVALVAARVL